MYIPGADAGLCRQIRDFSNKIQYVQKKDWWKHASTRALGTFSERSPFYEEAMRVAGGILAHVSSQAEQKNGINQHQQLPIVLSDLLKYYPTCPPDAFVNIKEFYQNPALNRLDENDKKVKVTLRNWCSTIRDWDIFDFNTYYHCAIGLHTKPADELTRMCACAHGRQSTRNPLCAIISFLLLRQIVR